MRASFIGIALSLIGFSSSVARADDTGEKEACIAASDRGQQSRDDGKYRSAREAFLRCSQATCPSIIRRDCVQWLVDLEQRTPTVVLSARDDKGHDLVDVRVNVDGVALSTKLDGEPVRAEPGEHHLHYEAAGFPPIEERVILRAGEKNRILAVQFAAPDEKKAAVETEAPTSAREPKPETPPSETRSIWERVPPATWVLGGVAVAGLLSDAYFGISGMSQRSSDLGAGGCAPRCSSSEISGIQTKFAVADVSLGVGIVSAGLAVYFLLRRDAPPPPVVLGLTPHENGVMGAVGGHF